MTEIWAHRGASGSSPENTLPAFARARDLGAAGVELDVHLTADGHVVVCHDETVDRTSNGTGAIVAKTLDELRRLDFSNGMAEFAGAQIPTLDEVYDLLAPTRMTVNVELKNSIERYPGLEQAVERLTRDHGMTGRVWYSSFHHPSMQALAATSDEPCALLHSDVLIEPWGYAVRAGVAGLHPHWGVPLVLPDYVPRAHEAGLRVHVWTVNDAETLQRMRDLGVDAVITNHPELA